MEKDSLKTTEGSPTRWDASTYVTGWRELIRMFNSKEFFLDVLSQINLPKDASVLEIGIGGGKWSAAFAVMGYKVTAMDNNPEMLLQAQRNFPNIKIEYVFDDLMFLSSEASKRKYDLVMNEGVLEHLMEHTERITAIKAMKERCIDGGYVYFIVPFLSDKGDEHRYTSTMEMGRELEEAGFTKLDVRILLMKTTTAERPLIRVLARNV